MSVAQQIDPVEPAEPARRHPLSLDRGLPPAMLSPGADADTVRRARVLLAFIVLMVGAVGFGAPYTFWLGFRSLAVTYLIAMVVALAAALTLHRTGRLDTAGNLLAFAVYLPLSFANFQTGGVGGSAAYLLGLVPVIAVLVAGLRSGLVWALLCALQSLAIGALHAAGYVFSHPLPREQIIIEQTVGGALLALQLFGLAAIYEVMKSRALADVERARAAARAAERAKAEFLANMSHEIRTPMNAVIGMTSILLDSPLSDEQRRDVETIRSSGELLVAVINDILDFSKIEAGRLELEQASFSVRECVEQSLELVAASAAAKGLELAYTCAREVPESILGDSTRVRQVLVNLLSNAVKFTATGAVVVSVDVASRTNDAVELHIAVRDTGIGIPADRIARLFQAFSQADASTTRRFGGTGLGLAISARLVELLGGRIWVESHAGQGSTFQFTICAPATPGAGQAATPANDAHLDGKPVLLVDDHPVGRAILEHLAADWRLDAFLTGSAEEALAWLGSGRSCAAAVIDREMADGNRGLLASAVRAQRPDLPIVLLTAGARATTPGGGDPTLDGNVGGAHYLVTTVAKPIKPAVLRSAIQDAIDSTTNQQRSSRETSRPRPAQIDQALADRIPLRILLAEDNPVNQRVAASMLSRMGYRADVVGNGIEALEALATRTYDVVLMDVHMPEMDGLEAMRSLIARVGSGARPRVVALTASVLDADRRACMAAGMDDFVTKPVTPQTLQAALERAAAAPPRQEARFGV